MKSPPNTFGIDPGQRHVGICSLVGADPHLYQIDTVREEVYPSFKIIRRGMIDLLRQFPEPALFVIERQGSSGFSSQVLYSMMISILDAIYYVYPEAKLALPLPIQVQSYAKHVHKADITNASSMVESYRRVTGDNSRVSQHKVDGYFMARMGQDLLAKTWGYKLPARELPIINGRVENGRGYGNNR